MEDDVKYDIILQNNACKKEWIIPKLTNISNNPIFLEFEAFQMPEDAPDGEYTYVVIMNNKENVEYELHDDILDSIVKVDGISMKLAELNPLTGLMKYGTTAPQTSNKYKNKNTDFIYRKR